MNITASAVSAKKKGGKMLNKKRIAARLLASAACLCVAACMGGCSALFGGGNKVDNNVTIAKSEDDITDNSFYVKKADGTYHRLYLGEVTFDTSTNPSSPNPERICWYGEDYGKIPTMNKGEELVYHSSEEFSPPFWVERFEDEGYTIGISGLTPTDGGRYAFSTNSDDHDICRISETNILYQKIGEGHTATIEMIGGAQLRSGNISRAGTIVGLEKGKKYKTDIYVGTEVIPSTIKADVRAFSSMEFFNLADYDYTGGNVITIRFPKTLESGYYMVYGFGMVRYIDSEAEFTEDMDMNVPNGRVTLENPSADQEEPEAGPIQSEISSTKEDASERFSLEEASRVRITLKVGKSPSGKDIDPPVAKVYGDYAVYTLNDDGSGTLTGTYDLPEGSYRLGIVGLFGREYTFEVVKTSQGSE